MNKFTTTAHAGKQFLAIALLTATSLICNGQQFKSTCTLSDVIPVDGNADELSGTDLVIGEVSKSRYPIQGLSRAELLMMGLPPIPTNGQFAGATLRLYLKGNTGNVGNASFGALSLYHCPHLPHPNITVSLADYADTNFVLATNSVVAPNSPTGQYYEIDVTAQISKSYELATDSEPVSDFRFQVDGLQYTGGSHYYEFDPAGGNYPPQLMVLFSLGPSIPVRPALGIQRVNSTVIFAWSTNYTGFVLESANSPFFQTWKTLTNQPITINDQFQVSIEAAAAQQFFRLHQ